MLCSALELASRQSYYNSLHQWRFSFWFDRTESRYHRSNLICKQFSDFHMRKGLFGSAAAVRDTGTMKETTRWGIYGLEAPELAEVATEESNFVPTKRIEKEYPQRTKVQVSSELRSDPRTTNRDEPRPRFKVHYVVLCLLCIPRMYKYYIYTKEVSAKRLAKLYVATLFLGSVCWLSDRMFCEEISHWYLNPQGHVLWHVFMGFNSYLANTFLMFCRAQQREWNPKVVHFSGFFPYVKIEKPKSQ